jgi:hypothetical protein
MLMTLTAAVVAATAIVSSASAGTVGCTQGNPTNETNLTSCRMWRNAAPVPAQESFAMAPKAYAVAPLEPPYASNFGHTDVSGGAH